jgi:hypothetical protein
MGDLWETLNDIEDGIREGVSDAIKDVSDAVESVFDDTWNNLVMSLDDMAIDIWHKITGVPKAILDGIRYMLRDPKFWYGLMAFYGLSALGAGLGAAQAATAGQRMIAFREAAGLAWGRLGAGFLTKAHKLTYLVSPTYRKSFTKLMEGAPDQMFEAGMDMMSVVQLIGDVGGLVRSLHALRGEDSDLFQEHWSDDLSNIGRQGSALFQTWGDDPNKFIDWIDDNILYDEHNKAAAFMKSLSESIDRFEEGSAEILGKITNITGSLKKVGGSIDKVFGSNVAEAIEKDLSALDEAILIPWRETNKLLGKASDALEVSILEAGKDTSDASLSTLLGTQADQRSFADQNTQLLQLIDKEEEGI